MRAMLMMVVAAVGVAAVPSASAQPAVRDERPRVLFGGPVGISVETFRTRCTSDPAYMDRCMRSFGAADDSLYPAAAHAAAYLVTGDASRCDTAYARMQSAMATEPGAPDDHSFISDHGRTLPNVALALDWCWDALDETQRSWAVDRIRAYGDWYVTHSPPDVYHDDMNNVWNAVALAGLVLAHTSADADARRFLAAAETQWKEVIFPAIAYTGDWWHEGFVYVQPTIGSFAWTLAAWSTASDEDLYAYARDHGDLVEGYLRMHAYALRPDDLFVYVGDTTDNKQSIELFTRPLVDMLTYGSRSPLGQGLSMHVRERSRPGYDYSGANGWMIALLYDASREGAATALSSLPTAAWLGRGSEDVVVMRSGWEPDSTYVWMSCGDYFSGHQHLEAGGFQIHGAGAMLTGSTGYYDSFETDHWQNYYASSSIHANTLVIVDPEEYFPTLQTLRDGRDRNVVSGGQRPLRHAEMGGLRRVPDLPTYLMRRDGLPHYETGNVTTFEDGSCHDYVACDVTAAYSSPGRVTDGNQPKVTEVTRQLVFLAPDTVVIFDRIESVDPSFEKRFLIHGYAGVESTAPTFRLANGSGVLLGQTLLPAAAEATVVGGFEVAGVPHPPSATGRESGGTRLEVSPASEGARDYFLHVLRVLGSGDGEPADATVTDGADEVTARFGSAGGEVEITFRKNGEPGGHLRVGGSCDVDLGAGGVMPGEDGGGPGPGRDAGPGGRRDGGGGGDAGAGGGEDGGCGCVAAGADDGSPAAAASGACLAALVALGVRRRRGRGAPRRSMR